jgi:hypothetical protein
VRLQSEIIGWLNQHAKVPHGLSRRPLRSYPSLRSADRETSAGHSRHWVALAAPTLAQQMMTPKNINGLATMFEGNRAYFEAHVRSVTRFSGTGHDPGGQVLTNMARTAWSIWAHSVWSNVSQGCGQATE